MFVERRINASTGAVELWWCEWGKGDMAGAKKIYVNKIADEADTFGVQLDSLTEESAICWACGSTLGNESGRGGLCQVRRDAVCLPRSAAELCCRSARDQSQRGCRSRNLVFDASGHLDVRDSPSAAEDQPTPRRIPFANVQICWATRSIASSPEILLSLIAATSTIAQIRAWIQRGEADRIRLRIVEPGLDVQIEKTRHRQIRYHNIWSSMPPETHSIEDSPLYELLKRKLDQLTGGQPETFRCIFLADVGSTLLRRVGRDGEIDSTRRRVSGREIISHFVSAYADRIDSVVVFAPYREGLFMGQTRFRYALGDRDGEKSLVGHCLNSGMTLSSVTVESAGLDADDDYLVLNFSDDPAARALELPSKRRERGSESESTQ
jgi:hypothetical protein